MKLSMRAMSWSNDVVIPSQNDGPSEEAPRCDMRLPNCRASLHCISAPSWWASTSSRPARLTAASIERRSASRLARRPRTYATSTSPAGTLVGEGQDGNAIAAAAINDLKAEKTKSYEVGAKAELFDAALGLGLALFRTETDNARTTGANGQPFPNTPKHSFTSWTTVDFAKIFQIGDGLNLRGACGYGYIAVRTVAPPWRTRSATSDPSGAAA